MQSNDKLFLLLSPFKFNCEIFFFTKFEMSDGMMKVGFSLVLLNDSFLGDNLHRVPPLRLSVVTSDHSAHQVLAEIQRVSHQIWNTDQSEM